MLFPGFRPRDTIPPFGVHILQVQVMGLKHMHVTVEDLKIVSCHNLTLLATFKVTILSD